MKKIYTLALLAMLGVGTANAQSYKLQNNLVVKTALKVADGQTVTDENKGDEVTAEMLGQLNNAELDADGNTLPLSGGTAAGANYHNLLNDYTDPETGITFAKGTYATLNTNTEIKLKDEFNPEGVSNVKQIVFYLASQGQLQVYAREYNGNPDEYIHYEGDPTNRKLKSYKAPGFATDTWTEMSFTKPLKFVVDLTNRQDGTEDEMTKSSLDINKKADDTEVVNMYLQFYEKETNADGQIVQGANLIPWTADGNFVVAFKKKAYLMGYALICGTDGAQTRSIDITADGAQWSAPYSTGINSIVENNTVKANNTIYTIDGRVAGTDKAALVKGLYIQNGQKFVVK